MLSYSWAVPYIYVYIKTHNSESQGQEEAAVRDKRVSYLHIAPLWKFENAVAKPPRQLSLSYLGLSIF